MQDLRSFVLAACLTFQVMISAHGNYSNDQCHCDNRSRYGECINNHDIYLSYRAQGSIYVSTNKARQIVGIFYSFSCFRSKSNQ